MMGQRGLPTPLVTVVASGEDPNTIGQAVSALRRLASNADNAVGMVRVRGTVLQGCMLLGYKPGYLPKPDFFHPGTIYKGMINVCRFWHPGTPENVPFGIPGYHRVRTPLVTGYPIVYIHPFDTRVP